MGRIFAFLLLCMVLSMEAIHPSIQHLSFSEKSKLIQSTLLYLKDVSNKTITLLFHDKVTGRTRIKVMLNAVNKRPKRTLFFEYYLNAKKLYQINNGKLYLVLNKK